ncbi:MAG: carbamate kinase [Clostridia bacterium]|nr:carbamate kinase [Clostridia bacterium]
MKTVIALGGNALGNTPTEQLKLVKATASAVTDLIAKGHQVIIGHGNGPQVGMINSAFETASVSGKIPAMPFPECGAMSQGYIGYHLAQAIGNELKKRGIKKGVVCVTTQVLVDANDEAFKSPTKPIGSFMTEEQAKQAEKQTGYTFVEDSGRGWRRVVASPKAQKIVELDTINTLCENDNVVITVGGGGIPVIEENGELKGVAAVIDKDSSCALLAKELKADTLIILTAVDKVCINFGKENEQSLNRLTVLQAEEYIKEGHFAKGSMLPKVLSCVEFAKSGGRAVIASLENAGNAMETGTIIEG